MTPPLCRIAYVDDDADIRQIAELALRDIGGLAVRSWGSGEDFLREWGDWLPQLVLLDLWMPGMDGGQTLAALRRQPGGAELPVVLLSGSVAPPEVPGLVAVLSKPFDPMTLADRLRGIWADLPENGG